MLVVRPSWAMKRNIYAWPHWFVFRVICVIQIVVCRRLFAEWVHIKRPRTFDCQVFFFFWLLDWAFNRGFTTSIQSFWACCCSMCILLQTLAIIEMLLLVRQCFFSVLSYPLGRGWRVFTADLFVLTSHCCCCVVCRLIFVHYVFMLVSVLWYTCQVIGVLFVFCSFSFLALRH